MRRFAAVSILAVLGACRLFSAGLGERASTSSDEGARGRVERCTRENARGALFSEAAVPRPSARCYYTEHLIAMNEGSLGPRGSEAYRLLWLRTYHRPVMVRAWADADGHHVEAKETDGSGGYGAGALSWTQRRTLRPADWRRLVIAVEQSALWTPEERSEVAGCLDGSSWLIEGLRDGRREVMQLSGCESNAELDGRPRPKEFRPGEVLLELAGVTIEPAQFY